MGWASDLDIKCQESGMDLTKGCIVCGCQCTTLWEDGYPVSNSYALYTYADSDREDYIIIMCYECEEDYSW